MLLYKMWFTKWTPSFVCQLPFLKYLDLHNHLQYHLQYFLFTPFILALISAALICRSGWPIYRTYEKTLPEADKNTLVYVTADSISTLDPHQIALVFIPIVKHYFYCVSQFVKVHGAPYLVCSASCGTPPIKLHNSFLPKIEKSTHSSLMTILGFIVVCE